MQTSEEQRAQLVELQKTLYASRNSTRRWLHASRRAWIEGALRRAGRSGRALEVGPGSGVFLPLMCDLFEEVTAIDVEEAFLANAGALPNLALVRDDISASALPPASFDVVLCSEVIEHLESSTAALRGMRRLLKPGGILVLSTPQRWSPLELAGKVAFLPGIVNLVRLVYREPVLATGHINLLTQPQLRRQLAAAGFAVRETHTSGLYVPVLAEIGGRLALRIEQALERRLRGGRLGGLLQYQYYICEAT